MGLCRRGGRVLRREDVVEGRGRDVIWFDCVPGSSVCEEIGIGRKREVELGWETFP